MQSTTWEPGVKGYLAIGENSLHARAATGLFVVSPCCVIVTKVEAMKPPTTQN